MVSLSEELYDALNVALIVGGSIVIPHGRHAVGTINSLRTEQRDEKDFGSEQ